MNIQRIAYFIKVAEHLSYRKAARELHISHQALSRQIQLLEEEIGAKLLERNTNQVVITEIGRKTMDIFNPVLKSISYGTQELQDFVKNKKNTLKLGYFNGLSYKRVVSPIVQQFEKNYPEIRIDILAADIGVVHELLMEDSVDVAVSLLNSSADWRGVESIVLHREPLKIVVSSNHPWYHRDQVEVEDIMEEKMLVFENRPLSGLTSFLPDVVSAGRIPVRNTDTYMGVLEQGRAFGVISNLHGRMEEWFKLFPLPEEYAVDTQLIIAYKKQHPLAKKIEAMKELLAGNY